MIRLTSPVLSEKLLEKFVEVIGAVKNKIDKV